MKRRKQADIIPVWTITIYEDEEQLYKTEFKGDYDNALKKAEKTLKSYKEMNDVFNATHYELT